MNKSLASTILVILIAALAAPLIGEAKRIYSYRDEDGILHFTDKKPKTDQPVESRVVRVEEKSLVTVRKDGNDERARYHFFNHWHGPVEVDIRLTEADNIVTDPPLPGRYVLPEYGEHLVVSIDAGDTRRGWRYSMAYSGVPGDPRIQPNEQYAYRLPFRLSERFYVGQAFGGQATHNNAQSFYAVDFSMPEGTPVLAARDGIVMNAEEDFFGAGLDADRYASRANNVRILHEDGTMAIYAHLQLESVSVRAGQAVLAGELIGLSGNTGFSSGPHLHFAIQRNIGMELQSIPFVFAHRNGSSFTPRTGTWIGRER